MASTRRMVAMIAVTGVAVLVAAALVLLLGLRGNGRDAPGTAGAGIKEAGQAATGSSSARPGTGSAAGQAGSLSAAAAAYLAGRRGTVSAAVYDVRTGQTWQLGTGPAQPEASVVKLDILETLLARPRGAALAPADQALARSMIEDSDNDAATSLWDEDGGARGADVLRRPGRAVPDDPVAVRDLRWVRLPGLGAEYDRP